MKKMIRRAIAGLTVFAVLLAMGTVGGVAAQENRQQNRFNVVFVTDESTSMKLTDPDELRYEAIRRFVGLMAQSGNYLGSVSFCSDVADKISLGSVEGFEEKNNFVDEVINVETNGFTNIGVALMEAVEELEENGNSDLPSVILLLSDGNTALDSAEGTEKSLEMKAEAIEIAREKGYVIYTICLNANGKADPSEMKQIADATGGVFTEVTRADDLEEVEAEYYKLIFDGIDPDPDSGETEIGEDGQVTKTFTVPDVGVEEINIIYEGEYDSCQVTSPSGYVYEGTELLAMSMEGKDFTLVKVVSPEGGEWSATAFGNPGTVISFKLLYNSSFYITTSMEAEEYIIGQSVHFEAEINDANGKVTDADKLAGFSATLEITCNGEQSAYAMEQDGTGFSYDFEIKDEGTYFADILVSDDTVSAQSDETYSFNVNNSVPVAVEEKLKVHVNRWPVIGGKAVVNLAANVSDPDGDELTISIESAAFSEGDYTLEDGRLTVDGFSIPKGSFTVKATDPKGAYCTFDVQVTSTNVALWVAICILVAGLLVLVILGIIVYREKLIPFMGSITVERFDDTDMSYFAPVTVSPGRGSVRLEAIIGGSGLPVGCKFQAGGRDKNIYFKSKKPVYSNIAGRPSKKLRIEGSGGSVRIFSSQEMDKGIEVTFKSLLYNNF